MSFLQDFMGPPGQSVLPIFPATQTSRKALRCSASCDVLHLETAMNSSNCCPCHGMPINTAGEHTEVCCMFQLSRRPLWKAKGTSQLCRGRHCCLVSAGSSVMCMCSVTNKTIRTADCAPDPSFVQIAPGSILHIAQHSAVSSKTAPPPEWDGQLVISTRVKVMAFKHHAYLAVKMKHVSDMMSLCALDCDEAGGILTQFVAGGRCV